MATGSTSVLRRNICRCIATSWTDATRRRRSTERSCGRTAGSARKRCCGDRSSGATATSDGMPSSSPRRSSATRPSSPTTAASHQVRKGSRQSQCHTPNAECDNPDELQHWHSAHSGCVVRQPAREPHMATMTINPAIFKAYDVRGLYPQELNEDAARLIGRGFVAYLKAKRIAVSRDMRLSSPSMAKAFIEGAREQGADVVDYGMMGTDMLYFAVARDGHDGGVQITASHNPKEYNGIKMVRQEAFPLSGESGIGDIRDMIAAGKLPPPAATRGTVTSKNVVDDYVQHVLSF